MTPGPGEPQSVAGADIRRHNLGVAMLLLAGAKVPMSRAALAGAAGMTRATAGSLVEDLLAGGLVREVPPAPVSGAGAGRPGTGLVVDGAGALGLGLEINVDYLAASLVDLTGTSRHQEIVQLDQRGLGAEVTLGILRDLAVRTMRSSGSHQVAGIAVAVPGLVDRDAGVVRLAPNLGWQGVDVLRHLRERPELARLPLHLGNEADFGALAELSRPGRPDQDFILVSGEIGVGAGIVVGGTVLRGQRGWGGEIGHITIEAAGPRCGCGSRGCLEQYCGQEAILRAAGVVAPAVTAMGGKATVDLLVALAESGDPAMAAALAVAGGALGIALAGVMNVLDIAAVVLGGIYAPLAQWIAPPVRHELGERVLWSQWHQPDVLVSSVGTGAAVIGAATSVVRAVIVDPLPWLNLVKQL